MDKIGALSLVRRPFASCAFPHSVSTVVLHLLASTRANSSVVTLYVSLNLCSQRLRLFSWHLLPDLSQRCNQNQKLGLSHRLLFVVSGVCLDCLPQHRCRTTIGMGNVCQCMLFSLSLLLRDHCRPCWCCCVRLIHVFHLRMSSSFAAWLEARSKRSFRMTQKQTPAGHGQFHCFFTHTTQAPCS